MLDEAHFRLDEIIARRHDALPAVERRIEQLTAVVDAIRDLNTAAADLPPDWAAEPEIVDALALIRDEQTARALAGVRASLEAVRARFSRDTVNIGVTGRARVGKSALLQSISGLGEAQVPTGDGGNVTAVQSRVFHAERERAVVQFHSEQTFMAEVIQPYMDELGLRPAPHSVFQFRTWSLDSSAVADDKKSHDLLRRLKEIQRAASALRLDGKTVTFTDLTDLRRYVAYPTESDARAEDSGSGPAPRDHLAVKDCRIETPFPITTVKRLGLVDLPGLGEVGADVEARIVAGLQADVDVVLMIFRAQVGLSNVDEIDLRALQLVSDAQGGVAQSRDFAWIMINAGAEDTNRVEDLKSLIGRRLNGGVDDAAYSVVTANGLNPEEMHERVLIPVLARIKERLAIMDDQVLAHALTLSRPALASVEAAADSLARSVSRVRSQVPHVWQELDKRAHELHMDVQAALAAIRPHSLVGKFSSDYEERLEAAHREIREWLKDGLGQSTSVAEWVDQASRERGLVQSHRPFLLRELHRLRVSVTRRYANLDAYLNEVLVEDFYDLVADAITGREVASPQITGSRGFLDGGRSTGSARIESIRDNLLACDPPVPGLCAAVDSLAGIEFDFRLQSFPLLFELNQDVRPIESATDEGAYPPLFAEDSTRLMYDWLEEEFIQYSFRVKTALKSDAARQFKVLAGAAFVLEDEVIRSGTSGAEFKSLAAGYRDEFWPGAFTTANSSSARGRLLNERTTALLSAITELLQEGKPS